jgi:ditrans,polycis-polyprenyl diphosphate synthase
VAEMPPLVASLSLGSMLQYIFLLVITPILPFIQRFILAILSLGPVPQHIGLIMDGNRRYARTHPSGPLPISQGHLSGFNALRSVLEACLYLKGLNTITVYAFAIDNFARDEKEVQSIMELAKKNLAQLAAHGEMLARHSVRLRMIGRRELLPLDVRIAMEKAERMTQRNSR